MPILYITTITLASALNLDVVTWIVLLVCVLLALIHHKKLRRDNFTLSDNIRQQGDVIDENMEYEMILKVMHLATWSIELPSKLLHIHYDYRQTSDSHGITEGLEFTQSQKNVHPDDRAKVAKSLDDICSGMTNSYQIEYRILLPDGSGKFYWEESFAIVSELDDNGHPKRIVGATHRIDDRKNMEQALVDSRLKAEESSRMKSRFMASMSHEIRTPLNSMSGYAQVLQNSSLTEQERQDCLRRIIESSNMLAEKLNSLVDVADSEAGKDKIRKASVNVNLLIRSVANNYASKNSNSAISVRSYTDSDECIIISDIMALNNVLKHFMTNAMKFTRSGIITVGYDSPRNGKIRIWVQDTGLGIAKGDQERIFQPFVKLDEFADGVGLGLSVCKNIAFNLDGRVGVESSVGVGSTFWIEIPTNQE